MDDDLNTPQALAVLFNLAKEINRCRDEKQEVGDAQVVLLELAGVLGLRLEEGSGAIEAAPFVDLLLQIRNELRAAKQFQLADRIRDGLAELNVTLEDGPQGTTWKSG